jgi:hypothetical protein
MGGPHHEARVAATTAPNLAGVLVLQRPEGV